MGLGDDYVRLVLTHYSNGEVLKEIARFSKRKWIAAHCQARSGRGQQYILRYQRRAGKRVPLTVNGPEDVSPLLRNFEGLQPRSFYASVSVYRKMRGPLGVSP